MRRRRSALCLALKVSESWASGHQMWVELSPPPPLILRPSDCDLGLLSPHITWVNYTHTHSHRKHLHTRVHMPPVGSASLQNLTNANAIIISLY